MAGTKEQKLRWYREHLVKERLKSCAYQQTIKGKYSRYKSSSKTRGISFNLSFEEFETFWQKPCSYCGNEISTIGIDRIDSSIGYTVLNCSSCCSVCNTIKLDYSLEFLNDHMFQMLKHQGII